MDNATLVSALVWIVGAAVTLAVLYFVIRAAVVSAMRQVVVEATLAVKVVPEPTTGSVE